MSNSLHDGNYLPRSTDYTRRSGYQDLSPEQIEQKLKKYMFYLQGTKILPRIGILLILAAIPIWLLSQNNRNVSLPIVGDIISDQVVEAQIIDDTSSVSVEESVTDNLSVQKPSRKSIFDYQTQADKPKRISIPKINVLARVGETGNNDKGEVGVPSSIFDTAWYNQSNKPKDELGSSVVVGHLGFRKLNGIFAKIDNLPKGAEVIVTNGDNTELRYAVESVETIHLDNFSMSNYLSTKGNDTSYLYLITCGGSPIKSTSSYDSRVVVKARLM